MITTVKSGIARLINGCVSNGMTHVVCSPGSRNAALIIAIDNHPSLTSIVIHDERSAAFYAIGMSQQLKSPVGLGKSRRRADNHASWCVWQTYLFRSRSVRNCFGK